MRTISKIFATALLTAACPPAGAVRLDYSLGLGLLYSDNINLSATDPINENVLIPHFDFAISETGSSVQADVDGVLEYRDYLGGTFGNEFRGALNGTVNWSLVPQRVDWVFANNLGLNPVSLRAPDVPDNLQQTNVFTTGPTFRFRLTPTLLGQAELRFIDSYAEETADFDSSRYDVALRALYDLGPTRQFTGNLEFLDIDFDNDVLADDYQSLSGFIGFTETLAQVDLNAVLGYTQLDFERGDNVSGPLVRASIDWRATDRSTFGLALVSQYTDAATSLSQGIEAFDEAFGGVGIGDTAINSDVYREQSINGTYLVQSARLNATAMVRVAKFRYEQLAAELSNRDELGVGINLGYLPRPSLTFGVAAEITNTDFAVTNATDRNTVYGVYVTQQMSQHWLWRADLARNERDADDGLDSYNENSIYLRVVYTR